jgi:hypothetical protein
MILSLFPEAEMAVFNDFRRSEGDLRIYNYRTLRGRFELPRG